VAAKLSALFAASFLGFAAPARELPVPPAEPAVVLETPRGLWVGTERGLYLREAAGWRLVLASLAITDLAESGQGVVAGTERGLYDVSADATGAHRRALGLATHVRALARGADGTEFVATERGLYRREQGGAYERDVGLPEGPILSVRTLESDVFVASDDAIWQQTKNGALERLVRGVEPRWSALLSAVARGPDTLLFVPAGFWRVGPSGVERVGLPFGDVRDVVLREEQVFVAARRGLYVLPLHGLEKAAPASLLAADTLDLGLAVDRADGVWAATAHAVLRTAGAVAPRIGLSRAATPEQGIGDQAIEGLQQAVLDYLELEPERLRRLEDRARRTGRLPELRLTLGYDYTRAREREHDQVFSTGDVRDLFDSTRDRDAGIGVVVDLRWDLEQLADPRHAIAISRERRELIELRDQVLDRVNRLYFERRRALARLATLPRDAPERRELAIQVAELAAQLDGWSGGYFTRSRRASQSTSSPTRRNP
jgi:hypothetical protein